MSDDPGKKLLNALKDKDKNQLQEKMNMALNMLKNNKIDKDTFLGKLNKIDNSELQKLNVDAEDFKKKMNEVDFDKLRQFLGDNNEAISNRLKDILEKGK